MHIAETRRVSGQSINIIELEESNSTAPEFRNQDAYPRTHRSSAMAQHIGCMFGRHLGHPQSLPNAFRAWWGRFGPEGRVMDICFPYWKMLLYKPIEQM